MCSILEGTTFTISGSCYSYITDTTITDAQAEFDILFPKTLANSVRARAVSKICE